MRLLERILVATDFTSGAHDTVRMASFVASHFQSEVILLHVVPGDSENYASAVDMIRIDVEEELRPIANRIRVEGGQEVQTIVDFGIPFDLIMHHANQRDVNVIIMGSQEESSSGSYSLGTTAAEVRRRASKPVWIVKPGTAPPISNILCPVNFSDVSGRALRNAIHLARHFQAELTLLTVAPCTSSSYRMYNTIAKAKRLGLEPEPLLLDRFIQDLDVHDVQLRKLIRRGSKPHEEILKVVSETQSDLLVMGSVGRKGLARFFMGGVERKVAREMPCSIVTLKSEHAIRIPPTIESTNIEGHFKQAHELLALGFSKEAESQFRKCIALDEMYVPAWEGLAAVYKQLGHHEKAKEFMLKAEQITEILYHQEIRDDIRGRHPLLSTHFNLKRNES